MACVFAAIVMRPLLALSTGQHATVAIAADGSRASASALYSALELQEALSLEAFSTCLRGYQRLDHDGKIPKPNIVTVIDYSRASTQTRLCVLDLRQQRVLYTSLVAHGRGSGENMAERFSNETGSKTSSLGYFITNETYVGEHGYTLRLEGLEAGINDNAAKRRIVVHGAGYVSHEFIEKQGRLGRSWGCPALPLEHSRAVIDLIKNGTYLFIYANDSGYLERSELLNPESHLR